MKKADYIILLVILITAVLFRLYKINTPLADLHSWRQVDTAAVARNFARDGFDLMKPRYDDLSSIETGFENPEGYRFVEFPLYNAIFAALYKLSPIVPVEVWGRYTSIFFSLIIIGVIYLLMLYEENRLTAIVSSLIYAVFPVFVFLSRVVLPETTALSFAMLSILLLYVSLYKSKNWIRYTFMILSIAAFACALLVKPTTVFYGLVLLYLFIKKYNIGLIKHAPFYIFFMLAGLPVLLWRYYIRSFPEGIPASSWLITSVNTYEGMKTIFFRPAFFRWIFFERLTTVYFGGYVTFFFILGILKKNKTFLSFSLLAAAFAFLFTFQGGNVQHEYYQTLLLPSMAIFVGRGVSFLYKNRNIMIHSLFMYALVIALFAASFFFSYYRVREYYNYPQDLVQIANVIKTLTRRNDRIVTDRLGDTTLLYLADRKGAPGLYKDPSALKNLGYNYLVTQNKEKIAELKEQNNLSLIFESDKFALFRL